LNKFDYIIPTWNSEATLELTLLSIETYGYPNKIIIVDRYSQDGTIDLAKKYNCNIIKSNECLGFARRLGAKHAKTGLIAFVDSDVELTKGWENIIQCASDKVFKDAGVIGAYYNGDYTIGPTQPIVLSGGNGAFGCCITYKDLILKNNELDFYSSREDFVYAKFIAKRNLKWYILPVPVVHHRNIEKIPDNLRWRWLGAGLRKSNGFNLVDVKKILGGAIFNIKIDNRNTTYCENFILRWNYFIGYIRHNTYYEIDRDKKL